MKYSKTLFIGLLAAALLFLFACAYAQTNESDKDKSIKEYFRIGSELENSRLFVEAITQYDRAIALDPKFIEAYIHKGSSLIQLGRYREAIENCRKVLAIDPKYTDGYICIAEVYLKQGYVDKAREVYDQLFEIDKEKAAELLEKIQNNPVNKTTST